MLDFPQYTALVRDASPGDPLGTEAINEMLYRSTFPGLNNRVRHVRVYTAICWMVRQIALAAEEQNSDDVAALSRSGLEKIQLLLTWYNKAHFIKGLPGSTRIFPDDDDEVTLSFRTLALRNTARQMQANPDYIPKAGASYMDQLEYGPSLVNGLRFLRPTNVAGAYRLSAAGETLADAYEAAIETHPWRDWLADPTAVTISRQDVLEDMGGLLDLNAPSRGEKNAFLEQFFPAFGKSAIGPNWANRQAGILLALRALEAEELAVQEAGRVGTNVETIRFVMASAVASNGKVLNLAGLEQVQGWWANLQLRQYLRTALSSLFRNVEAWVQHAVAINAPRDIADCIDGLSGMLTATLPPVHQNRVGTLVEEISGWKGAYPSLYAAWPTLPEAMWLETLSRNLLRGARFQSQSDEALVALRDAYIALVYCAVEAKNLRTNPYIALEYPDDRLSLSTLLLKVEQHLNASPAEFVAHVLQYHVLSLHFGVVRERSKDGRNRFRILNGDYGLERAIPSKSLPEVSVLEDRLRQVFALLAQCDMVKPVGRDRFVLTTKGRNRLLKFPTKKGLSRERPEN